MIDYTIKDFIIIANNIKSKDELSEFNEFIYNEGGKYFISIIELKALTLVIVDKYFQLGAKI
jgi:hypothetical protein